jgi:hypothetical protein
VQKHRLSEKLLAWQSNNSAMALIQRLLGLLFVSEARNYLVPVAFAHRSKVCIV